MKPKPEHTTIQTGERVAILASEEEMEIVIEALKGRCTPRSLRMAQDLAELKRAAFGK